MSFIELTRGTIPLSDFGGFGLLHHATQPRPVASHPGGAGGGGLNLDGWNTGADTGFPEGGGGHSQAAPPLGHCPRDVIRPPKN